MATGRTEDGGHVTVDGVPRFSGRALAGLAGACAALLLIAAWLLGRASSVLDPTERTASSPGGGTTTTTSTELAIAGFAVVALIVLGALIVLAGIVIALAELTRPSVTAPTGVAVGGEEDEGEESLTLGAGAIAAVLAAAGEVGKGLGGAVQGLRASVVAMLVGALIMIFGGAVAWQTVPGTDGNPTITITPTTAPSAPSPSPS